MKPTMYEISVKYCRTKVNKVTKTTYGELYQKTLKKQRFCEESGYTYISIWESEWCRFKNSIIQLQRIFKEKKRGVYLNNSTF